MAFNDSLTANGNSIVMDYHDGKYGINTSAERGADTFIPFNNFHIESLELIYFSATWGSSSRGCYLNINPFTVSTPSGFSGTYGSFRVTENVNVYVNSDGDYYYKATSTKYGKTNEGTISLKSGDKVPNFLFSGTSGATESYLVIKIS